MSPQKTEHQIERPRARRSLRRGLTLAELLVATTIMLLIATAMAMLAMTVHSANDHCRGQLDCAQHARIALERIERAVETAIANEQFPACLVVTEQAGSEELPQTLVVWSPLAPTSPGTRLPYVSEIVVFSPNPAAPGTLLEIRSPSDGATVPAATNMSAWRTLTDQMKTSETTDKIALTDRLRTAPLSGSWSSSLSASQLRGVVRFRCLMAPSASEWAEYRAGTRTWANVSWPLDSYRSTSGTRTVACQTELQLVAGNMAAATSTAIPFFGSTSLSYELPR
jgi:hypothetical protein